MSNIKYPQITIKLTGTDGNAFSILCKCKEAMKKAKISKNETDAFIAEATNGNYCHLIATCTAYFNIK